MHRPDGTSLWDLTAASGLPPGRFVSDAAAQVTLADLARKSGLGEAPEVFHGRSVLILCYRQLPAVLALIGLDGLARRVLLCPIDLSPAYLPDVIAEARVDVIVSDGTGPARRSIAGTPVLTLDPALVPVAVRVDDRGCATEWLLFTSGTTGRPKNVVHTLGSLIQPLQDGSEANDTVWSTFYDIRRYGGLQILLRALLGGGSLVLSQADESVEDFLTRAGRAGVTRISGTPSHWRRALMSPALKQISPAYVRLSGEVVDQAILKNLAVAFPKASIAHAFATTEAGVAFDVRDGLAGFPAALIDQPDAKVEMRVQDGSLRIRSTCTASCYLGADNTLTDEHGFIDTGDILELRGDRYHFVGRRQGIINVGGLKVHPEEVEAVINQHPGVQMVRVRGRPSPITGAIVVADIVRKPSAHSGSFQEMRDEITQFCQRALPAYKVPAILNEVRSLEIAESGKLVRGYA
jgi:acyl-CoA synthetase (AMP-forming)/AMP-acid ligase II